MTRPVRISLIVFFSLTSFSRIFWLAVDKVRHCIERRLIETVSVLILVHAALEIGVICMQLPVNPESALSLVG